MKASKYLHEVSDMENVNENALSIKIIEAAKKLFMEHGFKGTTTKMIAKEAGVNEATLFRHFKSKEGVFVELSKEITRYSNEKLACVLESDLPPEAMLYQFGIELYKTISESKGVLILAIVESKNRTDLVENVTHTLKSIVEILANKLMQLHQSGVFRAGDFFAVALMYVESLIGLFIVQTRLDAEIIPVQIERLCRSSADVIWNGLRLT